MKDNLCMKIILNSCRRVSPPLAWDNPTPMEEFISHSMDLFISQSFIDKNYLTLQFINTSRYFKDAFFRD